MAITETSTYYYGHGEAWFGDAVAGAMPINLNVPVVQIDALEISFAAERIEHISKRQSVARKDLKIVRMISGSGKMTCSSQNIALLKTYLFATQTTVTGGAFAATAFADALLAVSDIAPIPGNKTKISSLVITDSAGSPATLVLGTDYEADADAGVIKILSVGAYTQPFKAAGSEAAGTALNLAATQPGVKGMRFKGINIANANAIEIVNLPKIDFDPTTAWTLVGDGNEVNKYELNFEILEDTANAVYPFGQYRT